MRTDLAAAIVLAILGIGGGLSTLVNRATTKLHRDTDEEVRTMFRADAETPPRVVEPADLEPLPPPVQRWLQRSGVVGRPVARGIRLRQVGAMHTSPTAAWFPVRAEQYFTTSEPQFVWWMEGRMKRVLPLAGRDAYVDGVGSTHVTAAGLVDVANARGRKVDQGALLRWLAETVWFPSAALEPYVVWEHETALTARATITSHGVTAAAVFAFDEDGRPIGFDAERYYGADGPLEHWAGRNTEWGVVRGVEIPTRGEVTWHLETGNFTFYRWRITDVEEGAPFPYTDARPEPD
ncbi:MAG: hypothetical protein KIT84_16420 [Labilithrix sp.]|nr:hypothetical protein [Labilithrix sp.]MCW5812615.1 hypothetical protein [Labilithrix sp.]